MGSSVAQHDASVSHHDAAPASAPFDPEPPTAPLPVAPLPQGPGRALPWVSITVRCLGAPWEHATISNAISSTPRTSPGTAHGRPGRGAQWDPLIASQRSASRAAMQPEPAAVTAWRYTKSCTSPAAKTPGTLVVAGPGLVLM